MNCISKKVLGLLRAVQSRVFAVTLLSFSMAVTVYSLSTLTNAVYIRDGEAVTLTFTTKQQPDDILREQGIITMAYDAVDFTGFDGKMGEISIKRAFPVTLAADGRHQALMVTGGTVEDLLKVQNLHIDGDDLISHPLGMFLAPGDAVVIQRVETHHTVKDQEIPFEVQVRETSLIRKGRSRLLQAGSKGLKKLTYEQTTIDGILSEEQLIAEDIAKVPTTQVVLKGTGAAISPLDYGVALDANGKPTQYKRVITQQVATGYSAGRGAWGASGKTLHYGSVAVNPAEIPYGSKLYITSPDNGFVYGYAIAADTGIGLLSDVIDVDLYYETYLESCLNGRRVVDIYILG